MAPEVALIGNQLVHPGDSPIQFGDIRGHTKPEPVLEGILPSCLGRKT